MQSPDISVSCRPPPKDSNDLRYQKCSIDLYRLQCEDLLNVQEKLILICWLNVDKWWEDGGQSGCLGTLFFSFLSFLDFLSVKQIFKKEDFWLNCTAAKDSVQYLLWHNAITKFDKCAPIFQFYAFPLFQIGQKKVSANDTGLEEYCSSPPAQ